jgi:hypothetical protein
MNSITKKIIVIGTIVLGMPFMFSLKKAKTAQPTQLVIYSSNYGFVNEQLSFSLNKGDNTVYAEIPESAEAGTIYVRPLSPGIEVAEQKILLPEINEKTLLKMYQGKQIDVTMKDSTKIFSGTLLESNGELYLKGIDSLIEIKPSEISAITYKGSPELRSEPSLEMIVKSQTNGNGNFNLSLATAGLDWDSNYFAIIDDSNNKMNLESRITLTNNSGQDFSGAQITLIAGAPAKQQGTSIGSKDVEIAPNYQENPLFEYRAFDLEGLITLKDSESKSMPFFSKQGVSVVKEYIVDFGQRYGYYADIQKTNASVHISAANDKKAGLGLPMPEGTIRLYQEKDSMLYFIGEATIGNTSVGDTLDLNIGKAFDIRAEKKQTLYDYPPSSKEIKYGYEVKVFNSKATDEKVSVLERIPENSKIISSNLKYDMVTNTLVKFIVDVAKEGSSTLDYQILQTIN